MGDMNAPMPPMGADNMEPTMDDANEMGDDGMEPPMDDPNVGNGEDDELMDIINSLSIEDKAAVTKYAKSMANDSNDGNEEPNEMGAEDPSMGGDMPMESRQNIKRIIDEIVGDILDDRKDTKRDKKELPRDYKKMDTPFKCPLQ